MKRLRFSFLVAALGFAGSAQGAEEFPNPLIRQRADPHLTHPHAGWYYFTAIQRAVLATPYGLGKGVFWWEPAVASGRLRSRGMFDDDGNSLPVINVFDSYTRGKVPKR